MKVFLNKNSIYFKYLFFADYSNILRIKFANNFNDDNYWELFICKLLLFDLDSDRMIILFEFHY